MAWVQSHCTDLSSTWQPPEHHTCCWPNSGSHSLEQCSLTGGRQSSLAMSVFFSFPASWTCDTGTVSEERLSSTAGVPILEQKPRYANNQTEHSQSVPNRLVRQTDILNVDTFLLAMYQQALKGRTTAISSVALFIMVGWTSYIPLNGV